VPGREGRPSGVGLTVVPHLVEQQGKEHTLLPSFSRREVVELTFFPQRSLFLRCNPAMFDWSAYSVTRCQEGRGETPPRILIGPVRGGARLRSPLDPYHQWVVV